MSFHCVDWVLEHSDATLSRRLVLIVLADHAKRDGTFAWPAVDTIAAQARLSRRATQDALRRLEQDGAIVARGKSAKGTTIYDVVMGGADSARGADHDAEGAQISSSGGANSAPELSGEQSGERSTPSPEGSPSPDFDLWLAHHELVTAMRPPGRTTQARKHIASMYSARRAEGYAAADLMLAVDGAWADEFRREHGYVDPESVLRPTKVAKLVEAGRRARAAQEKSSPYDKFDDGDHRA